MTNRRADAGVGRVAAIILFTSLMPSSVLDRFLRYVTYDTQSRENSGTYPSTPGQLTLLRDLVTELRTMGIGDADIDQHGYVMATIPATTRKAEVPAIGFIAHVDTSPEMSGAGVTPIVHRAYDGRDLILPDDPSAVLRVADMPYLGECLGHDIVTASGTTLLGADNKSGVAEIMTAAERLMAHPGDSARLQFASRSRRTKRSARARSISTSRDSARATPTRWTAARAASSSTRASPPTRSPSRSAASTRIRATPRAAWSTPSSWRRDSSTRLPADHVAGDHRWPRRVRPSLRRRRRASIARR